MTAPWEIIVPRLPANAMDDVKIINSRGRVSRSLISGAGTR